MISTFLTYMKVNGWDIELNEIQDSYLPEIIKNRYANISKPWLEFIKNVKHMVNSDETIWFLCREDFEIQGDKVFQWNEWELISLESAQGDAEWTNEINEFWNYHLPIVMSVKDGYSYYAISVKDGSIVQGSEPEFEECEMVALSFTDFMEKITKNELRL